MKLSILAGAFLMGVSATAQITSPASDGFLSRGMQMWADKNLPGSFDQLGRAIALGNPGSDDEAVLLKGITGVGLDDPSAGQLLRDFLETNPESPFRSIARMALAEIDFRAARWSEAYTGFEAIDSATLDSETAAEMAIRRGFCRLMLGDYAAADTDFAPLTSMPRFANAARFYLAYSAYARGNYSNALPMMEQVDVTGSPGSAAPFFVMQMRFAREQWQQALDAARKLLQGDDAPAQYRVEALRVAGESLYNLNRAAEASDYLWKYAAECSEPVPSAFYILGLTEYEAGNTDAAIKLMQRVITAEDAVAQSAWLTLGQAYMRRGDHDSALMALERAYRMEFDRNVRETALYNYAVARIDGGRVPFGSSVRMLEDFLKEFPDSPYAADVEKYVITGYMTDNDYEAALAAINRVVRPSVDIRKARQRVLFVLATRDVQAGRTSAAEANLRALQAMGRGLDDSILEQSRLWMGDVLYTTGDYKGAAAQFAAYIKSAQRTDPNLLVANYRLGYALFAAADYKDALAAFAKAQAASSAAGERLRADIENRLGDCRYYTRDFTTARRHYQQAYEISPQSGDYALYQLAIVKGMSGDHRGKVEEIDRLVAQFPSTGLVPQALLEKAESLVALGDNQGAVATYTTLVNNYAATAPGRNGYLQLALIYLNTGNSRKAEEAYRTVIKSYPASDEARLAADDLKRLLAADGRLQEYADFVKNVPGAPELDSVEMDRLAFEAGEHAYATAGTTSRLEEYISDYPKGAWRAKALYYMAEHALNSGDNARAAAMAKSIISDYPHSEGAEQALLIQGEAESNLGHNEGALKAYKQLEKSASTPSMLNDARMGIIRSASALGRDAEVIAAAETMLKSSAVQSETLEEVHYLRAAALNRRGRHSEADKEWGSLAAHPASLFGAMSGVALAQSQLDRGLLKEAAATADALINANPPHNYWLARAFIVYSDILRKRGDTFEADEYLRSLRSNYPGKEADIQKMINQRLK